MSGPAAQHLEYGASKITFPHLERSDIQELKDKELVHRSDNDARQRQKNALTSHTKTSVLPSSPPLSVYSDEWQWDGVFPETIICTLKLFQAGRRKADQAYATHPLTSDEQKSIQWYKHDAYEALGRKQDECVKEAFRSIGTKEVYIRYGLCRIIGKKHEAWMEVVDFSKLEQTAIILICGFIRDHAHEEFSMEVSWEYATMQINHRQHENFATTIEKELSSKMLRNYVDKEYIPRADLIKIMNSSVIELIINEDEEVNRKDWSAEKKRSFFRVVQQRASRLQAVCVKQHLSMVFLEHLLQSELDDLHGPTDAWIEQHNCRHEDCETYLSKFRSAYYSFFPHKFDQDFVLQEFAVPQVIPLYHSEPGGKNLGYGAASTVCKVNIDPVQHSLSTVSPIVKGSPLFFCFKKFNEGKNTAAAFKREQAMIKKLASKPHDHITPHFAMWTQSGVSYILFPLAKYNLRDFMSSTPDRPQLTPSVVLWFLIQLRGLASAVDHFHWIGDKSANLKDKAPNQLGLAGFHHDIKAENILVFEKKTTQPTNGGIFKITDFGAGRFADLRLGQQSSGVAAAKGTLTYKAPDKKPSRPFDLWGLGCVFLELLIWALTPEQDGGRGFSSRRGWMSSHEPGKNEPTHPDDAFWCRDPKSSEIRLRPAVQMQLEDLMQKYCRGMDEFKMVTCLTQELFTIDPRKRPKAADVVDRLTDIMGDARRKLENDPSCYLQDKDPRSVSSSTPNAPLIRDTLVETGMAMSSTSKISNPSLTHQVMDHTSDSEGSPKPFLRRGEDNLPAEMPHVSEYSLGLSDPGPAMHREDCAPSMGEETIELEDGGHRPRNESIRSNISRLTSQLHKSSSA